jgi:hypothetical protein
MNSTFEEFTRLIGERYGNPNAVFASGKLQGRQKIRIIVHDGDDAGRIIGATATGQRDRRGHHIVLATDGTGRKYRLAVRGRDVLIKW